MIIPSGKDVSSKSRLEADDESDHVVLRSAEDVIRLVDDSNSSSDPSTRRKASRRMILVTIIALGGVFVDAYDFTSLSIGTVQLQHTFGLSSTQIGALSASMAGSALLGAFGGGYVTDRFGRRRIFILSLWLFVLSAIGAALAPSVLTLVMFRLLMGFGVGLDFPVALSFVAENTRSARRGRSVNASYANWYLAGIVGFLASYIGYVLGAGADLWRLAIGFGAVPAAMLLVLRYFYMKESPLWAAHQGNLQEAADILRRTQNIKVKVAAQQTDAAAKGSMSVRGTIRALFSSRYRKRAFLAAIIGCLQSIEYYALVFYLPVISQLIFGHTLLNAILGGILFSAVGVVGSVFQAWVCDRTGIRPLTLAGALVATIALLGIAFGHAEGSTPVETVMVCLFMIGHTVGPGPQGMAYATLSFPTTIRGSSVGWAQGMLRLGSVIGFLVFPIMLSAFGFSVTFAALALVPFVVLAVALALRWEPIGVDIEREGVDTLPAARIASGTSRPANAING